jgi:hypothetical protein
MDSINELTGLLGKLGDAPVSSRRAEIVFHAHHHAFLDLHQSISPLKEFILISLLQQSGIPSITRFITSRHDRAQTNTRLPDFSES